VIQLLCFSIYVPASSFQPLCFSICVPASAFQPLCSSICDSASVFQHLCSSICVPSFCVPTSVFQHLCSSICVPASVFLHLLCVLHNQLIAINDNLDSLRHLCYSHISNIFFGQIPQGFQNICSTFKKSLHMSLQPQ
jgi:hypothetical protein